MHKQRLVIFGCLIAFAVLFGFAGLFKAPAIERDVEQRVAQALSAEKALRVRATVNGRHIELSGEILDEQERSALLAKVDKVHGGLDIVDRLNILPLASPYLFEVVKASDGSVKLSGFAPDDATRQQMVRVSSEVFGRDQLTFDLEIAGGMPDQDWPDMTSRAMKAIGGLIEGKATLSDRQLAISGTAETFEFQELVKVTTVDGLPEAYRNQGGRLDIGVLLPTLSPYEFFASKNIGGDYQIKGAVPSTAFAKQLVERLKTDDASGDSSGNRTGKPEPNVEIDVVEARGMPDRDWPSAVAIGMEALSSLRQGELRASDARIQLVGLASSAEERQALSRLMRTMPSHYAPRVELGVSPSNDAAAFSLTVDKDVDGRVTTKGILPSKEAGDRLVQALSQRGFDLAETDLAIDPNISGLAGDVTDNDEQLVFRRLDGTAALLQKLQSGRLAWHGAQLSVTGELVPGETASNIARSVGAVGARGGSVDVRPAQPVPALSDQAQTDQTQPDQTQSGQTQQIEQQEATPGSAQNASAGVSDSASETTAAVPADSIAALLVEEPTAPSTADENAMAVVEQTTQANTDEGEAAGPDAALAAVLNFDSCQNELSEMLASEQIQFTSGSAEIDPAAMPLLRKSADMVNNCLSGLDKRVEVAGHTDARGEENANLALSTVRAEAVVDALVSLGVDANKLVSKGYGETQPIADNETEEGRAKNRRIIFTLIDPT